MTEQDYLYYDGTTRTYFKSNAYKIHNHIKDIFENVYLYDPSCKYVDLIRELQNRLEIPEIDDEGLCSLYSIFDGQFLDVRLNRCGFLKSGTPVFIIDYV